jgi:hypothetical protein
VDDISQTALQFPDSTFPVYAPIFPIDSWEIGIIHPSALDWISLGSASLFVNNDPAIINDAPGVDVLGFSIGDPFTPREGIVWAVFGANPFALPPFGAPEPTVIIPIPFGTIQGQLFGSLITLPIIFTPDAGYAYNLILTDLDGVVLDVLDPVLVLSSTLTPTVPVTSIPNSATLLLLISGLAAFGGAVWQRCAFLPSA